MNAKPFVAVVAAARERRSTQVVVACWVVAAAVLMLAVTVQPFRDTDVWWHLALGRYIAVHGIPSQEPFSFLAAQHPWVGQQWLYEVLLAGLVGAGGPGLASVVMGVVAACALAIAAASVPRSARVPGIALGAGMVFSGLVMAQVVGVRGQVITLFGVAVVMCVVARWREGRNGALFVLPPLFLLWANMHAGFIAGFAVIATALLLARPLGAGGASRRHLGAALGVSLLATLLNPAGPGLYAYVVETFANPTLTQLVTEWTSPDFHNIWLQLFEAEVVILVVLWAIGGGPDRFDVALAAGLLVATLQAQRNVSLFAIIAVPQIAVYGTRAFRLRVLPRLRERSGLLRPRPALALGVTAVVGIATALTVAPGISAQQTQAFESSRYPAAAATYYAAHFAGERLYSPDTWGGYLAYRFPLGRVVFLYDETAVFGDASLQRYLDIHDLHDDWTSVLQSESIRVAIVPQDSQEASALHEVGWSVECADNLSGSLLMSAPASTQVRTEVASEPLAVPVSGALPC